jgi:hypothetical protein
VRAFWSPRCAGDHESSYAGVQHPYYKIIDGVHFINPGSVGRMFDGDPRTSFAILKIFSGEIAVEHFRIPYPIEEAIEGLKKNRLPDIYAKMYRTGKKLN